MAEPQTPRPKSRPNPVWATLKALFRTRVTAGVLVVLPIWVTVLLVSFVFGLMRDASQWVVVGLLHSPVVESIVHNLGFSSYAALASEQGMADLTAGYRWTISIISVVLTIVLLYTIGLLTANIIGRRLITVMENIVDKVPLVKTIYRSSKQILASFAGEQSRDFQRVALIPFPQEKMRCVGFITATFKDSLTNEELATVFIPTTPNPTTGYLQILKRKDLVELDWSVEDAVRTIMSGGILRPDFLTILPNKERDQLTSLAEQRALEGSPQATQPDSLTKLSHEANAADEPRSAT